MPKSKPKSKHALLSASGASRWLTCTPSARLESTLPEKSSAYAKEGTEAHMIAETAALYWLGELSEKAYENRLAEAPELLKYFNEEMHECAVEYAKIVSEKVKLLREDCPDAVVEIEVSGLDFSEWVPEGHGTGDCIIVADGWLEIIDFKYGKGYRVEADDNPQMRLYALGALARYAHLYDVKNVRMTIVQPRLNSVSSSEMSVEELTAWARDYVKPRAQLAYTGEGEFAPSADACKFCRAKEQCRARADWNLKLFDDAPDVALMTTDEAGAILQKAADIKTWLADLESLCVKTLFAGDPVAGWKLVEGRSNRKFVSEDQVADAMKAAGYDEALLYERKLITLTQMEKDFGKKAVGETLAGLIIKPQGKPTLAPATDKRPAFVPAESVLDAFDEAYEE